MKKIILLFIVYCLLFPSQIFTAEPTGSDIFNQKVICDCKSDNSPPKTETKEVKREALLVADTWVLETSRESCDRAAEELNQLERQRSNYTDWGCSPKIEMTKIEDDFILKAPTLNVRIPGFDKFSDPPEFMDGGNKAYFPWIGEYINAIYTFSLTIISILAVIMVIISGIKIIFSGISGEKKDAYKRISQAVIGLVLAWGSYTLLYIINPQTVNLKSLGVVLIEPETIETEGQPETSTATGYKIVEGYFTNSNQVNEACTLSKYPIYAKENKLFDTGSGFCLGWLKKSLMDACGAIPSITNVNGAWDVAAKFQEQGKFHPCNLGGIRDGDLVFMTSVGSNWIGLWENFRLGENGCTVADASEKPVTVIDKNGTTKETTKVSGIPKNIPPITHIGIYYKGKIYHQIGRVAESSVTAYKLTGQTRSRPYWEKNNIRLDGLFVHNKAEFIAGYGSW